MELGKVYITIHIDDESSNTLARMKNRRLKRIGYVMRFDMSLATVLEFDDFVISVSNKVVIVKEPKFVDEFCKLQFREERVSDDIAYVLEDGTEERYEYRDYDMPVASVEVVRDHVEFDDPSSERSVVYDMEVIVILRSADKELMIFAQDMGAESIQMYESSADLNGWMRIENLWEESDINDNPLEGMVFKRTIYPI